jgi:hypothetical protein
MTGAISQEPAELSIRFLVDERRTVVPVGSGRRGVGMRADWVAMERRLALASGFSISQQIEEHIQHFCSAWFIVSGQSWVGF